MIGDEYFEDDIFGYEPSWEYWRDSFWSWVWDEVHKLLNNETTLDKCTAKDLDTDLLADMCNYELGYPSERENKFNIDKEG